jgi:hypothetical protein
MMQVLTAVAVEDSTPCARGQMFYTIRERRHRAKLASALIL